MSISVVWKYSQPKTMLTKIFIRSVLKIVFRYHWRTHPRNSIPSYPTAVHSMLFRATKRLARARKLICRALGTGLLNSHRNFVIDDTLNTLSGNGTVSDPSSRNRPKWKAIYVEDACYRINPRLAVCSLSVPTCGVSVEWVVARGLKLISRYSHHSDGLPSYIGPRDPSPSCGIERDPLVHYRGLISASRSAENREI